jgi:polysaccharide pyruvyl transferase WcaK-like protein
VIRLIHLANYGSTNIGNGALIQGTERVVSEDFPCDVEWIPAAWDDYTFGHATFDQQFVDLVNSHDGLWVNGAVALNGREYLRHTGSRLDLPLELWPEIRKPVIVHGISHRHWKGQTYHHLAQLRALVDHLTTHPLRRMAVRNDGTHAWLVNLLNLNAAQAAKIKTIPDPALFVVPDSSRSYPELSADRPNILISLNDEDTETRYPDSEARGRIIRGLAKTAQALHDEWNTRIVLVPHYFDDFRMLSDFIETCSPAFAHQQVVSTGLLKVDAAGEFYGRYAQADLAISMRVHSMSPAIGMGVPVVPLVSQDRMWSFLREADLADLAVDAFAGDFPSQLLTLARTALQEPAALRQRLQQATARMRQQMQTFNQETATLFE